MAPILKNMNNHRTSSQRAENVPAHNRQRRVLRLNLTHRVISTNLGAKMTRTNLVCMRARKTTLTMMSESSLSKTKRSTNLTLLRDLSVKLDESNSTGEAVHQQLAEIATKRWGQSQTDKVKTILEKYKWPQNCDNITEIRVNPEICAQITPETQKTHLQLANPQQLAKQITFSVLQMANGTMGKTQQIDNTTMLTQAVDTTAMLGHIIVNMNHSLSQMRKGHIRPALKPEYAPICQSDIGESKFLFGDNLQNA